MNKKCWIWKNPLQNKITKYRRDEEQNYYFSNWNCHQY